MLLACGAAVAPAYAPFARLRCVESGLLERKWAFERRVHRFPPAAERVALRRAALAVAAAAHHAAAAERTLPLVLAACSPALPPDSLEAGRTRFVAAHAVARWSWTR